jgi:hypothetical protein
MVPPLLKRIDMAIENHLDVVQRAREKYADLKNVERAGKIVNQVAWDLAHEGAGLFYKPGGTNYNKRSIDVIIFKPNGETFDVLGDAEGIAKPMWTRTKPSGKGPIANWRAATEPDAVPGTPPVEPAKPPSTELERRVAVLEAQMLQVRSKDIPAVESRVATLELAEYEVVEATTSRDAFHSHKLSAPVTRKVKK